MRNPSLFASVIDIPKMFTSNIHVAHYTLTLCKWFVCRGKARVLSSVQTHKSYCNLRLLYESEEFIEPAARY